MWNSFFSYFQLGKRSLKTQLALYFLPIAILPILGISFYATRVYEDTTTESLSRRAKSERDAIIAEIDNFELEHLDRARRLAKNPKLIPLLQGQNKPALAEYLNTLNDSVFVRLYTGEGQFLLKKNNLEDRQVPYLSKDVFKRVIEAGETVNRYFIDGKKGFSTLIRISVKQNNRVLGVIEEEILFSDKELEEIKVRRNLDVALLNRNFELTGSSLTIPSESIKKITKEFFPSTPSGLPLGTLVKVKEDRFSGFLFDLPSHLSKDKFSGYIVVLLPLSNSDAVSARLKLNMVFVTVLLVLVFALLIFFFSNQIVSPIEVLVNAMKKFKSGKVEEITTLDTTYEIDYLVRTFNEMTRNVVATKRALEVKLEELKKANLEIKNTQTTLVQSAKMISLGQIVAGVAHELNNPIAFIYSNMHQMSDYAGRMQKLISEYRKLQEKLPEEDKNHIKQLETELEIDYLIKDMEDIIRSVLDGANRTKDIVSGLRTFSRMEDAHFGMSDLHEGIRNTLKLLASELKNKITVHEEYAELPKVECSLSQLNQVFMNLLSNAIQATPAKGDIWIRTFRHGEKVSIEIEDSGTGIPHELLEKIFDPFFTTKKVGQGTGLGLSIAYGLIQKHNGSIQVESVQGKGTKFTIELPIHQPVKQSA